MKLRIEALLVCLLLLCAEGWTQQTREDSLRALLAQPAHDTVRLERLDLLINAVGPTEEGQAYNTEMGVLAKTAMASSDRAVVGSGSRHYASFLGNSGYMAEIAGDIPGALRYYEEALVILQSNPNPATQASLINNIGFVYEGLGDIPKAIQHYEAALHIRDSLNDRSGIATCMNNLGGIYRDQGEYDLALEYFRKFDAVCKEIKDSAGMALARANIGGLYFKMGDTLQARTNLNAGLELSKQIGDEKEIGHALFGLGNLSFSQGNYTQARAYYTFAMAHQKTAGHKRSMANSMLRLAETDLLLGEPDVALTIALEAHDIANKTGYVELIASSASTLKEIYKATGRDSLALVMYELEVKMRDSIKNETNRKTIVRNGLEYEYQQKKAELDQKSERETLVRNVALGGLGVVLIFLLLVLIQRNRISRERKRSDNLLLNILPSKVAEELKESGRAKTQAFDDTTILFTDFKDFTSISEKLSPVELVEELDYCFKEFDRIIGQSGIEKIKTTGDAYLAAGGVPVPSPTHAIDTVKAAKAISDFMIRHKKQRDAEGKITFEIRIGVHSGPVVAGIVGVRKFAYDIWGDTVNTASRMESSGESGKVNVSETTYEKIKDHFICVYRGKIAAKNKGEIAMYFVEDPKNPTAP